MLENLCVFDFKSVVSPEAYSALEAITNNSAKYLHTGTNFLNERTLGEVATEEVIQELKDKDLVLVISSPETLLLSPFVFYNIQAYPFTMVAESMNLEFPLHISNLENLFGDAFTKANQAVVELKQQKKVKRRFKTDVN